MDVLTRAESDFLFEVAATHLPHYLRDRHLLLQHLPPAITWTFEETPKPDVQFRHDIAELCRRCRMSGSNRALCDYLRNLRDHISARLDAAATACIERMIARLAPTTGGQPAIDPDRARPRITGDYIDLPHHLVPTLYGRQQQRDRLNQAWHGQSNVVALVGPGGAGKTSVVFSWCEQLTRLRRNFGVEGVFAWTFYNHVATTRQETAVDDFAEKALAWLGLADRAEHSLANKFALILDASRRCRCLMVLDGVETLIGQDDDHRFVHLDMRRFLSELCRDNRGLCVLTSRVPVADLHQYARVDDFSGQHPAYEEIRLGGLTDSSGADLLRGIGVQGERDALFEIARVCQGHALTLHLLGHYLKLEGKDASTWRDLFPLDERLSSGRDTHSRHTRRIMEESARGFGDGPENALLEVLSLFSTAVPMDVLHRLRGKPGGEAFEPAGRPIPEGPIPDLTDAIAWPDMNRYDWQQLVHRLCERGLVFRASSSARFGDGADTLGCHLAVRAFYADRLKARPGAWQAGHAWIYRYVSARAPEYPNTIEDMSYLLSAVPHACQAGFAEEVMHAMMERCCRGTEYYINRILGIPGTALQALSHVFDEDWSVLKYDLPIELRGRANWFAGYVLMATGRLMQSRVPFRQAFAIWSRRAAAGTAPVWLDAAMAASDLSEVYLTLGELSEAAAWATRAVQCVERTPNACELDAYGHDRVRIAHTVLGLVSQLRGDLEAARASFASAVDYPARDRSSSPELRSLQGYRYHDFLLSLGRVEEVAALLGCAAAEEEARSSLLARGLRSLMQARVASRLRPRSERAAVLEIYDAACERLRRAGRSEYVALGLIARSAYLVRYARSEADLDLAAADLESASETARHGGMRLREMQAVLVSVRLELRRAEDYTAGEVSWPQLERIARQLDRLCTMAREIGHARRQKEALSLRARLEALQATWRRSRNAPQGAAWLFLKDKVRFIYVPGFHSTADSARTGAMETLVGDLGDRWAVIPAVGPDGRQYLISELLERIQRVVARSKAPYFLCGSSLGGYVAALAGSANQDRPARRHDDGAELLGVLMLSPSFGIGRRWLDRADAETRARWQEQGWITWDYGGQALEVPYAFVEDALSHAEFPALDAVPAMVIHGIHDEIVPVQVCRDYTSENESVVLRELPCDHSLEAELDAVVHLARAFFTQALKGGGDV